MSHVCDAHGSENGGKEGDPSQDHHEVFCGDWEVNDLSKQDSISQQNPVNAPLSPMVVIRVAAGEQNRSTITSPAPTPHTKKNL
jgi:hypothetical protein